MPSFRQAWRVITQSLVFNIIADVFRGIFKWLFDRTHGVTSKWLSRVPASPDLVAIDSRCNRVRLKFIPHRTSIFNQDVYEVRHALAGDDERSAEWRSDPDTDQEGRVIAPLQPNTAYMFSVRAKNAKGCSEWSNVVRVCTLYKPVDGGADLKDYKWTQSGIEVSLSCPIPSAVRAKDVTVQLRPQYINIAYRSAGEPVVLLEGQLPHRVRTLTPGGTSYWELNRDAESCILSVIMEKEKPARNIKFDFWRCALEGHPEIDTHYIDSDPHVKPMQPLGGFEMQNVNANMLDKLPDSLRSRERKTGLDISSLPINMQRLYKQ